MTDYFAVQLPPEQIRAISSIGLAHLGDAVFELLVRTWLCAGGKATGRGLHRATVALVCAPRQAELAEKILPLLTQEEQDVFRRGRNSSPHTTHRPHKVPKSISGFACCSAFSRGSTQPRKKNAPC